MKTTRQLILAMVSLAVPALMTAPNCAAQCGAGPHVRTAHTSLLQKSGGVRLLPAALMAEAEGPSFQGPATVVGFWHQQLISEGNAGIPDGIVLDDDLAQWHSDHTEIQNTKSRTPATGNFCLGVWERTGRRTYKLNHFPQAFDSAGTYEGTAQLREEVTVSEDGNEYHGTFTLDQYDANGENPKHYQGKIKGKRITVESSITDVLDE